MPKRKCKGCGNRFDRELKGSVIRSTMFFHDKDCLIDYTIKNKSALIEKGKKARVKESNKLHAKKKREFYDNDLPRQLKLTQSVFNKLRKLQELKWFKVRGLEPECISCAKKNMDWCCGHLKTVGAHGELRFDDKNTYLQCNRYCNMGLSGNINGNKTTRGFIQGLSDRFGDKCKKEIMDYLESKPSKKWNCEELIQMRKEFSKQVRALNDEV